MTDPEYDLIVSNAIGAAIRLRMACTDRMQTDNAVRAIRAIESLKACRRPQVIEQLDSERLARCRVGA